jgi:hypothetical protein
MKSIFTTGFSRSSFVSLDGLGQDEPTTMPPEALDTPPEAVTTTGTSPWNSIVSAIEKAAIAIKFPDLKKTAVPTATAVPAPSSGTGTILAVAGAAAAVGLAAYLAFRK